MIFWLTSQSCNSDWILSHQYPKPANPCDMDDTKVYKSYKYIPKLRWGNLHPFSRSMVFLFFIDQNINGSAPTISSSTLRQSWISFCSLVTRRPGRWILAAPLPPRIYRSPGPGFIKSSARTSRRKYRSTRWLHHETLLAYPLWQLWQWKILPFLGWFFCIQQVPGFFYQCVGLIRLHVLILTIAMAEVPRNPR